MYGREIDGKTYTFEPSGGLLNASLVMLDAETGSYWSIMTDEAIYGAAEGQELRHLPGSVKITFGEWRRRHPSTVVLSVEGKEHDPNNPYDRYFSSSEGFRKIATDDDRLEDKAPIYAFQWRGKPHAVPHALFRDGGAVLRLNERQIFLYRQADDAVYRGTTALLVTEGAGVEHGPDGWMLNTRNGRTVAFDADERSFGVADSVLAPMPGIDTFWYIWSLTHPETGLSTEVAARPSKRASPGRRGPAETGSTKEVSAKESSAGPDGRPGRQGERR